MRNALPAGKMMQQQYSKSKDIASNVVELGEITECNSILQCIKEMSGVKNVQKDGGDDLMAQVIELTKELEEALQQCKLVFVRDKPTVNENDPDRIKYKKRMEMLRLKVEETKYRNLTGNLSKNVYDDDVTTKSMTYATSIVMNMVVAPLSFAVFVYVFAGQFLTFEDGMDRKKVEARRVIASVVGGVFMLFVEMLLFVIRSHQLDEVVRSKKSEPPKPFGYYSKENAPKQRLIEKKNM